MSVATLPEAFGDAERAPSATTRPAIVCLTPMRDEAWMVRRFLACTELWADHIIVADQGSADGSREIAAAHPKVTIVDNKSRTLDERVRQQLLLGTARELVSGPRLLLALDVDEALTANWMGSVEWQTLLAAPPGTVAYFQRIELLEYHRKAWMPFWEWPCGFVDDGRPHFGGVIHSDRVPAHSDASSLHMRDVKVLHYAGVDMRRVRSRNRWYQCWEVLNRPERRPADVFRQYHQLDAVPAHELVPVDPAWTAGYERRGIDMTSVLREPHFWWDTAVLDMIAQHGGRRFRRVDLWRTDWREIAARVGREVPADALRDPRTLRDRLADKWLWTTQGWRDGWLRRTGDRALRLLGW